MTRIENFIAAVEHRQPDQLILDLGGCPLSSMEGQSQNKLLEFLGLPLPKPQRYLFGKVQRLEESLLKYLDIDTRSVGEILKPLKSQYHWIDDNTYVDEWGIKRVYTGLYWDIVENPLKDATVEDLEHYEFPEGNSLDEKQIEEIQAEAKRLYEEGEYVICAEHPIYGVFELGCWLCGFEDFLTKLILEPEFVHALFEKILDYQKKVIDIYYGAIGPYIHYTSSGDDFATQRSTFLSPQHFRELIQPYFTERITATKKLTKAKFLHHSCGSVDPLIPNLIECGVDILNPIQPVSEVMQPDALKAKHGKNIVFHGGVDTQSLLPTGTKESIEEGVKDVIRALNKDGGYLFAAAHNIQEDVPPENIVHMFQAARKYGKKGALD